MFKNIIVAGDWYGRISEYKNLPSDIYIDNNLAYYDQNSKEIIVSDKGER